MPHAKLDGLGQVERTWTVAPAVTARDHLVHDVTERIHVGASVGSLGLEPLWGHVRLGADQAEAIRGLQRGGSTELVGDLAGAEIQDLEAVVAQDEYILGLEVAVHHVLVVG